MKVKSGKLGGDDGGNGRGNKGGDDYDSLSWEKVWGKCSRYAFIRLPSCDKRGHSIPVSTRIPKYMIGALETIREKAPKGTWANQSDQLRSYIAIGSAVTTKLFKDGMVPEEILELARVQELTALCIKKQTEEEVLEQAFQAANSPATEIDVKKAIALLEERLYGKKSKDLKPGENVIPLKKEE